MREALERSIEELKRVDHLFYVSLKYTRTVDIIKTIIGRLINCFEFGFDSILNHAKDNKKIDIIPSNFGLKCELLKKTFHNDTELFEYINLYLLLRKLLRMPYTKREEFRRHVTMIATIDNNEIVEVNIDVLKEHYEKTKNFVNYVKTKVLGEQHG